MQNKSIDAIGGITIKKKKFAKQKPFLVDSLIKIRRKKQTPFVANFKPPNFRFALRQLSGLPILTSMVLILVSFTAGAYFFWRTDKSLAKNEIPPPLPQVNSASVLPVVKGVTALGPIAQVPNEILFNLTLDQLESYLAETFTTAETQETERLEDRKFKLKIYLDEKKSPLIEIADALAGLKHWKLVLAISNSESTLGKRCHSNNCSGIGVKPGHPLWRTYENKAEWARDLDRLLEKRYRDYSLEEMNGVYNKPGSRNWLMASKQILQELQERGIE